VDAPAATPASREVTGEDHIRPFKARVLNADVTDLRRRLAATRWPDKETVADQSQGAQLATLKRDREEAPAQSPV
jgi:Epoxide hydrolase N terminus